MDPKVLKEVPLFAGLSRRVRNVVAQHADEVSLPEGTKMITEGALAYDMYVILEGSVEVWEGDSKIAELGPGDVAGEIGVLETHLRTATVIASTPVKALVMFGPELTALEKTMPSVFAELESLIRERTAPKG
ncbi:MAG: cyclic nucleotide-binding domain-containing protein [Acidimicrobiia bacterium]